MAGTRGEGLPAALRFHGLLRRGMAAQRWAGRGLGRSIGHGISSTRWAATRFTAYVADRGTSEQSITLPWTNHLLSRHVRPCTGEVTRSSQTCQPTIWEPSSRRRAAAQSEARPLGLPLRLLDSSLPQQEILRAHRPWQTPGRGLAGI